MAIEPDGKIVLAGSAIQWTPRAPCTPARRRCFVHWIPRAAVARLTADGQPDPSFGVGGGVVDFRGGEGFTSVGVSPGRGVRLGSVGRSSLRIVGLDGGGHPNLGFGRDGIAFGPPASGESSNVTSILPQPDGSLVVGGNFWSFDPKVGSRATAVAMRFSAGGEARGLLGEVGVPLRVGFPPQLLNPDLVPLGDAFVAVGTIVELFESTSYRSAGFLARFSDSAFPYDPGFGGGAGLVRLGPFPGSEGEVGLRAAAADEGGLIAVGREGSRILLARYHADGTLDASFGEAGLVSLVVPTALTSLPAGYESRAEARAVAVQPDGRYVIAGSTRVYGFEGCSPKVSVCENAFLARLEPDGSPDTSFGEGGFVLGDTANGSSNSDLALQPDGKILLSDYPLRVARYNADGSLDGSFGEGGEAGVRPCQGKLPQRRRSGCLSTASVQLRAHGLSHGRPVTQFSIQVSNPLDPIAALELRLPPELEGRRGTAGKVRVLAVPRHRVRIKVRPGAVHVNRLGNARGIHVAVDAGVLHRVARVARGKKLRLRLQVKFKDGSSKTFAFRSSR